MTQAHSKQSRSRARGSVTLPRNRGKGEVSAAIWGREGSIFGEEVPGELGVRSPTAKQHYSEA